ncbi:hemicentin-1-like isoform X2 [Stylophora pistillata]|uniref:hemicentin-1-like isoform X2 n=1 Tax=Stylophora pistillata TaxID=50429 RepID=UPI000C04E553|nr:hemicentin-1-like isoform X2 [Stylophora pistillata]
MYRTHFLICQSSHTMGNCGPLAVSFVVLLLFPFPASALNFSSSKGRKVTGIASSSVNLTWTFSGEVKRIELENASGPICVINSDKNVTVDPYYTGRISVLWNGKSPGQVIFTLSSILTTDEGAFRCKIGSGGLLSPSTYQVVELTVLEAPHITPFSSKQNHTEGSAVNISCKASGKPLPDVAWVRNTKVKSSGKEEAFLVFSSIQRSDKGEYKCRANNTVDVTSIDATIVVYYKPKGVTLTTNAPQNTVTQGDTVKFTCKVKEAKPQVSLYKFFFNGRPVNVSNNNVYTINNVKRSQNYGEYKCIPRNDAGDGPEAKATLNIQVPAHFTVLPQNITVNTSTPISLTCKASGFPTPHTRWEKSEKILSHMEHLNIPSSNRSAAGEYMCTVGNGVGEEKTARAYVIVQYPPTIQSVTPSSSNSWIDQTVTLECHSDGVPTPTLTWYKHNISEINRLRGRGNKIQVTLRNDRDFGDYICVAANGLPPSDERVTKINQIKKPGQPSIESIIQATFLTIQWTAPAYDGGSPIIAFRVTILKGDTEIGSVNITNPLTKAYSFRGLERDTSYTVKVFSRNVVFEGDPAVKTLKTLYEGAPDVVKIGDLSSEIADDTITLKWKKPENNGKVITMYTVYQRVVTDGNVGQWTEVGNITDVSVRELKITLERGKVYQFAITATNELGESLKQDKADIQQVEAEGMPGPTKGSRTVVDNGVNNAIFSGAAVAGVLLIIGVIVIIILWRRRKSSIYENDEVSMDRLDSANHYEADDGFQEVSRAEAAHSRQASGPEAEANYAQVDMTKKKKNRRPAPNDEYAQVDKSKKTKRTKVAMTSRKRPGELDYADLEDLRVGLVPGPSGATAAGAVVRPPAYEGTDYADITQFGVPQPDPTYANVSKGDVTYSNMQSIA